MWGTHIISCRPADRPQVLNPPNFPPPARQLPNPSPPRSRQRTATAESSPFQPNWTPNTHPPAMSRALLRSVLELRTPVARLLPSLRPTTATPTPAAIATTSFRFFNQTAQHIEPTQPDPAVAANIQPTPTPPSQQPSQTITQQPPPQPTTPFSDSVRTLLPLLAAQPGHYITVLIHGRPYLVTQGDSIRLPFRMPGVQPGDVLRLNRASVLGSRDFTLQGSPHVDERLFACRAVVTGTESEPMRVKIKKKRRTRRSQTVKSKHRYTMLRISELRVCKEAVEQV